MFFTTDRSFTRQTTNICLLHGRRQIYVIYMPDDKYLLHSRRQTYVIYRAEDTYILFTRHTQKNMSFTRQKTNKCYLHGRRKIKLCYLHDRQLLILFLFLFQKRVRFYFCHNGMVLSAVVCKREHSFRCSTSDFNSPSK